MTKTINPAEDEWAIPLLGIALALTLAIGIGFLMGQQTPPAPDDMSAICRHLAKRGLTADCIALRSAVATEDATSVAGWALWVSFGSLVASSVALVGLIIAFRQGQRNIALVAAANRISQENGQAQARAYVVIKAVECQLDEGGQLTARVKFQNSGLSPARRLRWLYNAHLVAVYGEDNQRGLMLSDEPDLDKSHWRQDIPSAETWTSVPLGLRTRNDPEIGDLIDQAIFIAGTVKIVADYQDVFGSTHREVAYFQGRMVPGGADASYEELERANDDVWGKLNERFPT